MRLFTRRSRTIAALAAIAAVVPLGASATANAAPERTANTTTYSSAAYLREVLNLPVKPKLVIESVTYDRFQWLLQQEGQFAFLIGDPATDATFADRAQEVEDAADTAGVKRVYWFNPNLSGNARVGNITEPNLDIRNPNGIASIGSTNRTIYGRAWHNLVSRYLGNGVAVTQGGGAYTGSASITTAVGTPAADAIVNDYGAADGFSTKIGNDALSDPNGGALYDYTGGTTPPNVQDSYFFLYNKDATVTAADTTLKPAKIVAWVDLTKQPSATAAKAAVVAAINKCGASNIKDLDEYSWWKSATNKWQTTSSPNEYQGANNPVITDADGDPANGGWRVHQITYPELVFLLKTETEKDVVLLFGGTWCPNTRPVLPFINRDAQRNDVTVFNFDTILDGSIVGGGNASSNPLQVRGPAQSGNTLNPSFIYGDLVTQYLSNLKTEYLPTASNRITYYPGGDTAQTQTSQPRLQVPYLFGYRGQAGDAPHGGINRQWIYDKGDGTYTEYMSSWQWTNPKPDQLGVSTSNALRSTPIWATINNQLPTVTWQTDPDTLKANTAIDTDAAQFLTSTDKATVGGLPNVSVASSTATGAIDVNPTALSAALTALGDAAPANYQAARTALIAELNSAEEHQPLRANLRTVVGAWGVSQSRKNTVNGIWGSPGSPGSVAGGLAAVHAAQVFFDGLPGGVISRRTVAAAGDVAYGTAQQIDVTIANDFDRVPTGTLSLVVTKGGATVATASKAVADDKASFTLPVLDTGTYDYTLTYPGDDQIAPFTETGSFTVGANPNPGANDEPGPGVTTPITTPGGTPPAVTPPAVTLSPKVTRTKVLKVTSAVGKTPTRKKRGSYKVTISTPKGGAAATGKVTIKLKKGKVTKTISAKLSRGVVTFSLPKLAKGTWKVTISWPGDAKYLTVSATGTSVKVIK